jgi:hypothetical protein
VFDSRQDAKRRAGRSPGLRPYLCPHCGCYHLSSKSLRAVKRLRAESQAERQAVLDARWRERQAARQAAIDNWDRDHAAV